MHGEPTSPVVPPLAGSGRPILSRSRSHTDPSKPDPHFRESETAHSQAQPARPSHNRSKSYLSSIDAKGDWKSRHTHTSSALERTVSRLHLPGSSHRQHHKEKEHRSAHHRNTHSHAEISEHSNESSTHSLTFRRHRPTQSEAHGPRRFASKETLSSLPHLVAGLNAERERRTQQGSQYNPLMRHTTNTQTQSQNTFGPSEAQGSDYQPGGRYNANSSNGYPELRRRATSDPHFRDESGRIGPSLLKPKTSLEETLERGDAARVARRIHVKEADLLRRDEELQVGEEELRSRVSEITATGVDITRRLDYSYYNLLEKVGSLVSMIGSFQSVAKQSLTLITNFDRENERISEDTKRRIATFQEGFAVRRSKAQTLAERGEQVSARATDLSARLEAARAKVQEWDRREEKFRKAWDRVWAVCWRTTLAVIVLVLAIIIGKEWYFRGDPVKAGLKQHAEGNWNKNLRLGGGGQAEQLLLGHAEPASNSDRQPSVPDDVKDLLAGIAERNRERKKAFPQVLKHPVEDDIESEANTRTDEARMESRLRTLDEL